MKRILCLFLLIASPLWAKSPHKPVPVTPAPVVAPQEAIPMARQRTVAEDDQLKTWIIDIQTTAQDQMNRADAAETEAQLSREKAALAEVEAKSSRDHSAISEARANEAEMRLADVQIKFNAAEDERDKAIVQSVVDHKARVAADAHVSKIKTYLGFALGALLALVAEYVLAQITLPPPLNGYLWLIRIGAPVLAFGLGWTAVARFV